MKLWAVAITYEDAPQHVVVGRTKESLTQNLKNGFGN